MMKRKTLNLGSILCLTLGIASIIILITLLLVPTILYIFGEFLNGVNLTLLFLWGLSSILVIIGGIIGKIKSRKESIFN